MAKTKEQDKTRKWKCGTIKVPSEIFEHWTHSHEEDTEDVKVYRPHGYDFPIVRGRTGFEIKENGEFIQYDIAPTCGIEKVMGRWEAIGENKIKVYFESQERESYILSIVSCDKDILMIKQKRRCGTTEVPPEIFEHWIHSYKEDTEDVRVYRPYSDDIPLVRRRTGFEIKENGEFIQYDIAPACGIQEVMGRWEAIGKNKIKAYFESQERESYILSIVSCDKDILMIEQ